LDEGQRGDVQIEYVNARRHCTGRKSPFQHPAIPTVISAYHDDAVILHISAVDGAKHANDFWREIHITFCYYPAFAEEIINRTHE
jgi:hypothetical protein